MENQALMMKTVDEALTYHQALFQRLQDDALLKQQIVTTALLMVECLKKGGKILTAGNGGSCCQADHLAEELAGFYKKPRKAFAAVSLSMGSTLTCIANDIGFEQVFARQLEAYGQPGDIFYGLTTSGNSANILKAIDVAHQKKMEIIILANDDGGKLKDYIRAGKIKHVIHVPGKGSDRVQEAHLAIIHMHIDLIEKTLCYGDYDDHT